MLRMGGLVAAALMALALTGFVGSAVEPAMAQRAPDPTNWRQLDPENTLYIDTAHGRIVVEMYPEVAPNHVERIKALRKSEEREEIESYLQREREGGRFSFEDILGSDLRLDRDEQNPGAAKRGGENGETK